MEAQRTLEALVAGRERIRDYDQWWGLGQPEEMVAGPAGHRRRRCALQALDFYSYKSARAELDASASKLFGLHVITLVNDRIGHAAVLRCYNDAIARVQAEILTARGDEARESDLAVSGD